MTNERVISNTELSSSLSQMAENTTTAELVRTQGQTKKVKVVSERKLMDWILALLYQHLASKQDSFSDREKEELLAKTRDELRKRMHAHQEAEKERDRARAELERVVSQISASQGDSAGLEEALTALRAQLDEAQGARSDLEQDTYELQDQLQEKLNLLSTTIAEKEQLRDAVRNQMLRSNALVESVLGLDTTYYASRHQEGNPVAEDASDDERFYHDFDIGAKVIETLSHDLETLRTITGRLGESDGDGRSLAQDLDLLSQLKAGELHAVDVAAPIGGLIEALGGARAEVEALDEEVARATGGQATPISDLPDADGNAAEVIAGATAVARELAAELARDRGRITALRNLADEADQARNETEEELEALRRTHQALLSALAAKAPADIAPVFSAETADDVALVAAVERLSGGSADELEQLAAELAQARAETLQLRADAAEADRQLAQARTEAAGAGETVKARQQEIETLQSRFAQRTHAHHQVLARAVVDAARGDDRLADTAADLALGLDADAPIDPTYAEQVQAAVENLSRRKLELERELAVAQAEVEQARSSVGEAEHSVETERREAQRLRQEAEQQAVAARTASDEMSTAAARVEHMRRELDEALAQARAAQEEAEAAKADAAEALGKAKAMESLHTERIRTDRILAGELLAATREDDLLADVTTDLSVAIDDDDEVGQQLQKTVSALAQRQHSLTVENSRLTRDSDRYKSEVAEAKRSLASTQRRIAETVIQASRGDEDLKDSVSQLEWALERMRPGEPLPDDLLAILNEALDRLANRKQGLQEERDEMALSGKEIIGALTATRDQREIELKALRTDHADALDRLTILESRTVAAESANRDLAEALSRAAGTLPETEEARVELELALSQLPDEGEEGIEVPSDLAAQIASHGARIVHTLARRQADTASSLALAEGERTRLARELEESTRTADRSANELGAVRQELANSRMLHVEIEGRVAQLEQDLQRSQGQAQAASANLAELRADFDRESERYLAVADDLAVRIAEADGLRSRLASTDQALVGAQAEIAEFQARGGATGENLREELSTVRRELLGERETLTAREHELSELREKTESAEVRLKRLRDEFTKRLEERDQLLQQKDRELDGIADRSTELTGLRAQVDQLAGQLASAHSRIHELETQTGVAAGATGRHTNQGAELKRTQSDRDLLREQKRTLEADLAEANSLIEEIRTQKEELRKEFSILRDQVQKSLDAERAKNVTLTDELGRARADRIGLETRLRKLTGG